MAKKILELGLQREQGFLYVIRGCDVWKMPFHMADVPLASGKSERILRGGFTRESGYLYFIDGDGDISCMERSAAVAMGGVIGADGDSNVLLVMKHHDMLWFSGDFLDPPESFLAESAYAPALILPPGMKLRGWLSHLCSPTTRTRILDPVLADMQHEWLEAHKAGKLALARWIHVRGIFNLLAAMAARIPLSVIRWAWEAWKKTKLG